MQRIFKQSALAVLALVVLAFAAGCGSKSSSESPATAMQNALEKTATITSGNAKVDGSLSVGSLPGSISVSGGGPFDTKAKGGAAMDLQFTTQIAGSDQKFGIVSVDGKNYVTFGDKALEQKGSNALEPGQIADFLKGPSGYLTDVKSTGDNKYTASIDVKKLIADNKSKSGSADLSKLSIPGVGSGQSLEKSLTDATIGVTVDGQGYASTMDINLTLSSSGSQGGLRAKVNLSEIDQPQTIEAPKNVVSSPSQLGGLGAAISGL